jgi:dihydroorotate dehydrogenase/Pyruvate/2-oxoacid:ferredoxin oxidoreductase delta subunit
MSVDLSIEIAGVKFKNPILPGAGELAEDVRGVKRMLAGGVGGIVTKSYTSVKSQVKRPRPNNLVLRGRGYTQSGSFITYSTSHPETVDIMLKGEIPRMAEECKKAGVPFVVSYWGLIEAVDGQLKEGSIEDWAKIAQGCEKAGADMLEANLSCPVVKKPFEDNPMIAYDICKGVVDAVKIPVGFKISPTMGPIEKLTKMIYDAGAAFIAAHNAPDGIFIDVENEEPLMVPAIGGYIIGRPFLPWSLSRVIAIRKTADIPVMGIGGVYTYDDALSYILCGCPVVQVCTAIYLHGPKLFKEIIEGIEKWMERKGYKSIKEYLGKVVPMVRPGVEIKAEVSSATWAVPPNTPYVPVVDADKCTLCGLCEPCFEDVYKVNKSEGRLEIRDQYCVSCGMCVCICPSNALKLVDRETKKKVVWTGKGLAEPYRDLLKRKGILKK